MLKSIFNSLNPLRRVFPKIWKKNSVQNWCDCVALNWKKGSLNKRIHWDYTYSILSVTLTLTMFNCSMHATHFLDAIWIFKFHNATIAVSVPYEWNSNAEHIHCVVMNMCVHQMRVTCKQNNAKQSNTSNIDQM